VESEDCAARLKLVIDRVKKLAAGQPAQATKTLTELPTPAALVLIKPLRQNCDRMLQTVAHFGITLRAMTKTHKTIEGALFQLFGTEKLKSLVCEELTKMVETAPIVVSTLGEAEFFAQHNFKNILYPYPPSVDKLQRAKNLMRNLHVKMHFSFDNVDVFSNFVTFWESNRKDMPSFTKIPVYIDVDPDDHRTGVYPEGNQASVLAKKISESSVAELSGLYVHGGSSYLSKNKPEIQSSAEHERDIVLRVYNTLKKEGLLPSRDLVVATGSTPTASVHPSSMTGITEMHPGNYIFYDAHQYCIGSCRLEDCAATILTRVLSRYDDPHRRLLIDAGAFALSKDRGPVHLWNEGSYGLVVDHPEAIVSSISQEVGTITAKTGQSLNLNEFKVGAPLQLIPNHSCLSSYCYDFLNVVDENGVVVDQWKTCPRH